MAAIEFAIFDGTVLIDEEDLVKVAKIKWYVVSGSVRSSNGLRLSHLIAGKPPTGLLAAHWDGNFRNNQKSNIRHVTQRINMARDLRNTKGYYWDKSRSKWSVSITVNYRRINGGRFDTETEAAQAAYDLRVRLQGEICR